MSGTTDLLKNYDTEKIMPHEAEAEKSVLGAIFIDVNCLADILQFVKSDDFYLPQNKSVFESILEIYHSSEPVDFITVMNHLKLRGLFEQIGGFDYLTSIVNAVPTTANVKYYAKIVEEKSVLRKLIAAAGEIENLSYQGKEKLEDILEHSEQAIFGISQRRNTKGLVHIGALLNESFAQLEELALKSGSTPGISTGFVDLDKITTGFHPSDLIIIAAATGGGKSSFAINIAQHIALNLNIAVAIFSLEMSGVQLANRMLSAQTEISSSRLAAADLYDDDWIKIGAAMDPLCKAPIYIDDSSSTSPADVGAKCRRLKLTSGLGVVIVDYLQLMQSHKIGGSESRQQEIAYISHSLKRLAKELDAPIIALSQLSRESQKRATKSHEPILSDLRESGAIEQDADVVIFLHRDYYYDEENGNPNHAKCIVAKHRNGSTGKIDLVWQGEYTRFKDWAGEKYEQYV